MGPRKYLIILHTISCGQNGSNLGSDEQDIVLLVYLILDLLNNKVISSKKLPVRPSALDVNENILSDEARNEYRVNELDIKHASTLRVVVNELDKIWREQIGPNFTLVTDGQLPLRQCLHPEANRKSIDLPSYYNIFHDIRKEFQSAFQCSVTQENLTADAMLRILGITSSSIIDPALRHVNNMATILLRFLSEGHELHEPEIVHMNLMQGIRTSTDQVDTNSVVRARGLPWQASDTDIARFFTGLNVAPGGVALCLSPQGRRNGEAVVLFESSAHRDMALRRHKHHIGNRYIEVYKATGEEFIEVAGGNNSEAQEFLSRGGQVIIRMRGLPYDCSSKQVIDFFNRGESPCKVLDDEQGVLFVKKPDGRATGDAFVLFSKEGDGEKALSKHKDLIGSRYIELFRSTTAEVQQVLNRSLESGINKGNSTFLQSNTQQPPSLVNGLTAVPPMAVIPQQMITSGIKKDCIRLRGLPYEAQVEHILEFLGDHARNIVVQGVHMVFNAQGQPSGEAFIQMDSENSANKASVNRHNRYMVIGKKQRYIEVLQCSGEDMSLVLTGGLAAPSSPNKSQIVSPGMLQIQTSVATSPTASSEQIQLNPFVYPSNLYLNGLLPTNTNAQHPGLDIFFPQQSPLVMFPSQRLISPPWHHTSQSQFLLPPPQLQVPLRPVQSPFQLSLPSPSAIPSSSKRTHDQAFHSAMESIPPKRPPVLYSPSTSHGNPGLLPIPTISGQNPYTPL